MAQACLWDNPEPNLFMDPILIGYFPKRQVGPAERARLPGIPACNFEAEHQPANRHCLFDNPEPALQLARRYSGNNWQLAWPGSGHCNPSPYCAVEVSRKMRPFAEPARSSPMFEWPLRLLHNLVEHALGHGGVFETLHDA